VQEYVLWLVFSFDARFATRDYHRWLCAFQHELGVESLWDLAVVDMEMAEESEVWHALSAADQQYIATLFGRDESGRPRFTQRALATLQALGRTRLYTCSAAYQRRLIFNLMDELNKERSILRTSNATARELAASMPIVSTPDILWMETKHRTRVQPLTAAYDRLWATTDHHVLWLVFSLDARFATRYYHEWLCDFLNDVGIRRLRDLEGVDFRRASESDAWRRLSEDDMDSIYTLLWHREDGQASFVEYAKRTLQALCLSRVPAFSRAYQREAMHLMLDEINSTRARNKETGARFPIYRMPDIVWEHDTE